MTDIQTALEQAFAAEEEKQQTQTTTESNTNDQAAADSTTAATESASEKAARDEKGRFAPKATDAPEQQQETQQDEQLSTRKAPSSWKPAAQEAFLKADRGEPLTAEEIKLLTAEAERRESDFHRGVSEFKGHSERAKAYDAAIAPYQQHLQRLGVDAPTAINELMQAEVTLRTGDPLTKANYLALLAREYGIDLNQVQQPQNVDPQTQYLMQQLNELRQNQQMWQNQIQQQEKMKAQQVLQSFSNAEKPHFDAVRNDMADLLETGKAKTLEEAYTKAIWMRPDIRQTLIDTQIADVQKKALAQAQAQRVKTASVSVKGSSPASSGNQPTNGSLEDILRAQFDD
jgi:hypothetical protein